MNRDDVMINANAWNKRTDVHFKSEFYNVAQFLNGAQTLQKLDLELLGNIKNKNLLHLQCHFGLDTLNLCRLGANCLGLDISSASIKKANLLSEQTKLEAAFITADVHDLEKVVAPGHYDIIYTSYGVLCWVQDLSRWAKGIANSLKPGGKLVLIDYHPLLNVLFPGSLSGEKRYLPNTEGIYSSSTGTYADKSNSLTYEEIRWTYSIAIIIKSLIACELKITHFDEHSFAPYPIVSSLTEVNDGVWTEQNNSQTLPYIFSLIVEKPNA